MTRGVHTVHERQTHLPERCGIGSGPGFCQIGKRRRLVQGLTDGAHIYQHGDT